MLMLLFLASILQYSVSQQKIEEILYKEILYKLLEDNLNIFV